MEKISKISAAKAYDTVIHINTNTPYAYRLHTEIKKQQKDRYWSETFTICPTIFLPVSHRVSKNTSTMQFIPTTV